MKAQFIVTIEGKWIDNDKPVTARIMERELREGVKECFAHLADRVSVKRTVSAPEEVRNQALEEAANLLEQKFNWSDARTPIGEVCTAIRALRTTSGKGEAA